MQPRLPLSTARLLLGTLALLAAGCTLNDSLSTSGSGGVLAITHVDVVPVSTPGLLRDQTVILRGERIEALGPADATPVPAGARRIDGRGLTAIPGLCDMHEHIPREEGIEKGYTLDEAFALQLAAGVTTIRSMRGAPEDVELREAIRGGERPGPRMILGSPGVNAALAPDPESARATVREFAGAGYDFLKILEGFDAPSFAALVDEANRLGLPIAGHLPDGVELEDALAVPFWSLEHTHGYGRRYARDPAGFGALARATRESGTWICPTLGFQVSWYAGESVEAMAAWPGLPYANPLAVEGWIEKAGARAAMGPEDQEEFALRLRATYAAVGALAEAEVPILVSASGGWFLVPGFSVFVEMRQLELAGLSPERILRAATWEAARSVGEEEEWGSLQPGLVADLVLLGGNPLEDLRHAEDVRAVVRRGTLYDRDALDRGLAALRWMAE